MRTSVCLLVAVAAAFTALAVGAFAQAPAAGLSAEAARIADVVNRGVASEILAELPPTGEVTRTAYPGGGEPVSPATARADIPRLIVSTPGARDASGSGAFRLVATWQPATNPNQVLLIASGIGPDGRVSVAFTVAPSGGKESIVAYGRILDLTATLAQFAAQGDLRLRESPPGPPATGTGTQRLDESAWPLSWSAVAVPVLGVIAMAAIRRARQIRTP